MTSARRNTGNDILLDGLVDELTRTSLYFELKAAAQSEVDKPAVYSAEIRKHLKKYFKDSGFNVRVQNLVFKYLSQFRNNENPSGKKEPLEYIQKAQIAWEKCVVKSINSMCTELSLPLSRKRSAESQATFAEQFNSLAMGSAYDDEAAQKLRPVYSAADFFETLIKVTNPNYQTCRESRSPVGWGLVKAKVHTKNMAELERTFSYLDGKHGQCGIDDLLSKDGFSQDHYKLGRKVIAANHSAAARQYCKQGCPAGLRRELWRIILGVTIDDSRVMHFDQLKNYVFDYDLLVDHLVMKDVRLTTANSDAFFVFEDLLNQILLVFSRDTWLLKHFSYSSASPAKSFLRGKLGQEDFAVYYPPSGIVPFHGFAMYAAPLCYIFDEPVGLYYVFRELYVRYFSRLHCLSSHRQGILSLCLLFERLLQSEEPMLFKHLIDIEAQPLRMVFNWLLFAFSGYLETDQTLQLWDRILAFDTLELLSVLAVAILGYRKDNLMAVTSPQDVEAILADLSTIRVVPVLTLFFSGKRL